jgi:predicted AlkP superfamily phosphohydrolase/phosphomutase
MVEPANGKVATFVIGPRNPKTRDDCRFDIVLELDPAGERVKVVSAGFPQSLEVQRGRWSDWLRLKFKLGTFQAVYGIVRFHLIQILPHLEFYASPINFDPETPLFPISSPPDFARDLAKDLGLFYTTGMVEDHVGLMNERIDEGAFLAQCEDAWRERRAMMVCELDQPEKRSLFFCLYDTPDRVQHMLWRFGEPDHPANRDRAASREYLGAIEDHYRRGDVCVGDALAFARDDTLVIALSDHGFGTFRRGFQLNAWLHDQGLLALKKGFEPGQPDGDLLRAIDWDRTRAYGLGLAGLYLNLRGREAQGIVAPEEAENLKAQIARELTGLRDPETGEVALRSVRSREELYSGPFVGEAPDLIVNCAPAYRLGWESSMGAVAAGGHFDDNTRKWSGDHIIDPALVPGVLFMNRPFRAEGARLIDLAPTILAALGVPPDPALEGQSLLS